MEDDKGIGIIWTAGDFPSGFRHQKPEIRLWNAQSWRWSELQKYAYYTLPHCDSAEVLMNPNSFEGSGTYMYDRLVLMNRLEQIYDCDGVEIDYSGRYFQNSQIELVYSPHANDILHGEEASSVDRVSLQVHPTQIEIFEPFYIELLVKQSDGTAIFSERYLLDVDRREWNHDLTGFFRLDFQFSQTVMYALKQLGTSESVTIILKHDPYTDYANSTGIAFLEIASVGPDVQPKLIGYSISGQDSVIPDQSKSIVTAKMERSSDFRESKVLRRLSQSGFTEEFSRHDPELLKVESGYIDKVNANAERKSSANLTGWGEIKSITDIDQRTINFPLNLSGESCLELPDTEKIFTWDSLFWPTRLNLDTNDYFGAVGVQRFVDERGIKHIAYVDGKGQLRMEVKDSAGLAITTKYEYDLLGRLIKVTNPLNQDIQFEYDIWGRLLRYSHPDMGITKFMYDNADRPRFMQFSSQIASSQEDHHYISFIEYDVFDRPTLFGEGKLASASDLSSLEMNPTPLKVGQHSYDLVNGTVTLANHNNTATIKRWPDGSIADVGVECVPERKPVPLNSEYPGERFLFPADPVMLRPVTAKTPYLYDSRLSTA